MKTQRFYYITRQIHLYVSLLTLAFLLMYIVTSYMFIYHDFFKVETASEKTVLVDATPEEINDENWADFMKTHKIRGRLIRENQKANGDLVRLYETAKGGQQITLFHDQNQVEIIETKMNLNGKFSELHRLRGYGGPWIYNLYALLLDIVALSLILFTITGIILWLKLLKHNTIAWLMLLASFLYVGSVIGYLMFG